MGNTPSSRVERDTDVYVTSPHFKPVQVTWTQKSKERSETFYVSKYELIAGMLFDPEPPNFGNGTSIVTKDEELHRLLVQASKSGTGKGEKGVVFVQKSKLDQLKAVESHDWGYVFKVGDEWQYGEHKEAPIRFLVYHDKHNEVPQHSFVENFVVTPESQEVMAALGYSPDQIQHVSVNYVGPLKNF